jgi:phosphatidylserine/phosphatidylglycerophosphate/cardiolipin synthase-like enzyme
MTGWPSPTPPRTRRGVVLCVFLATVLLLGGCSVTGRNPAFTDDIATCLGNLGARPAVVSGVFVEPDDGYEPVMEELAAAQCTIDLTIYMLTDESVFAALTDAALRGVRVRVILDQHPFGMFGDQQEAMDRLIAGGVEVQWGQDQYQFTHAKYMVIDGRVALIMNQNLTRTAFNGNREYGVVTTEPDAVDQAQAIFEGD